MLTTRCTSCASVLVPSLALHFKWDTKESYQIPPRTACCNTELPPALSFSFLWHPIVPLQQVTAQGWVNPLASHEPCSVTCSWKAALGTVCSQRATGNGSQGLHIFPFNTLKCWRQFRHSQCNVLMLHKLKQKKKTSSPVNIREMQGMQPHLRLATNFTTQSYHLLTLRIHCHYGIIHASCCLRLTT